MKRKITVVGLIAAVAAVVAAAAAFALTGGELPANRTSGHIVIGAMGSEIEGGDPGSISIAVESWSWGVSNSATFGGGGGGGAGRATLDELSIVKTVDKASPVLALKCAQGAHIQQVVLTVDRPGGLNRLYMEFKLTDVLITKVQPSGSGDAIPLEEVSFTYRTIQLTYTTREGEVVQTEIENA